MGRYQEIVADYVPEMLMNVARKLELDEIARGKSYYNAYQCEGPLQDPGDDANRELALVRSKAILQAIFDIVGELSCPILMVGPGYCTDIPMLIELGDEQAVSALTGDQIDFVDLDPKVLELHQKHVPEWQGQGTVGKIDKVLDEEVESKHRSEPYQLVLSIDTPVEVSMVVLQAIADGHPWFIPQTILAFTTVYLRRAFHQVGWDDTAYLKSFIKKAELPQLKHQSIEPFQTMSSRGLQTAQRDLHVIRLSE